MSKASQIKKAKFCLALFAGKTAKDSALQAGYRDGKGIDVTALRLTRDPFVIKELERLRSRAEHRAILKRDEALSILSMQARGNLGDFIVIKKKGRKKTLTVSYDFVRAAEKLHLLQEIQITEATKDKPQQVRIKLHDPQSAIEQLSRMLGWNEADTTGPKMEIDARKQSVNLYVSSQKAAALMMDLAELECPTHPSEQTEPKHEQNGNGSAHNGANGTGHA